MADVQECIGKLVNAGAISREIGEQALDMFRRSKAEYSKTMGPASADAPAALQSGKTVASVTLPNPSNGYIGVFDIGGA